MQMGEIEFRTFPDLLPLTHTHLTLNDCFIACRIGAHSGCGERISVVGVWRYSTKQSTVKDTEVCVLFVFFLKCCFLSVCGDVVLVLLFYPESIVCVNLIMHAS